MINKNSATPSRKHVFQTLFRTVIFLLIIFVLYLTFMNVNQRHGKDLALDETKALDLRSWEFSKQGVNFLESGWQFYPEQLLEPGDFQQNSPASQDSLPRYDSSSLPHFSGVSITTSGWKELGHLAVSNSDTLRTSDISAFGYGTYRLVVKVSDPKQLVAIDFPEINQSAQIWINGVLLRNLGTVSAVKDCLDSIILYLKNADIREVS